MLNLVKLTRKVVKVRQLTAADLVEAEGWDNGFGTKSELRYAPQWKAGTPQYVKAAFEEYIKTPRRTPEVVCQVELDTWDLYAQYTDQGGKAPASYNLKANLAGLGRNVFNEKGNKGPRILRDPEGLPYKEHDGQRMAIAIVEDWHEAFRKLT